MEMIYPAKFYTPDMPDVIIKKYMDFEIRTVHGACYQIFKDGEYKGMDKSLEGAKSLIW